MESLSNGLVKKRRIDHRILVIKLFVIDAESPSTHIAIMG